MYDVKFVSCSFLPSDTFCVTMLKPSSLINSFGSFEG